jgi:hypothetical protein
MSVFFKSNSKFSGLLQVVDRCPLQFCTKLLSGEGIYNIEANYCSNIAEDLSTGEHISFLHYLSLAETAIKLRPIASSIPME